MNSTRSKHDRQTSFSGCSGDHRDRPQRCRGRGAVLSDAADQDDPALPARRIGHGVGAAIAVLGGVISDPPAAARSAAAGNGEPDGYTLLFASSGPLAITPALYKNLDYDPNKNFVPVATVSSGPMVLVVSPTLQINSVQELVAYAKANPGTLNYGATVGTPPHMAWGLFTMLTGTDIVYVPYKGAAAAFTDLVAGQIQMNFDATGSLLPLIREGKLKALAVSSASRNPDLPEVPTMVESGIDFLMSFWTAVLAPVGTPPDIVSKLNATINAGLGSAEMKATLAKFQVEAKAGSAQDFAAFLAAETKKWADVAKAANIKVE
jgi:tripartite-type tricarboxylate transporter receptor subunit TctC